MSLRFICSLGLILVLASCTNGPKKLVLPILPLVTNLGENAETNSPSKLKQKTYVAYIYRKSQKDKLYLIELAVADCIKKNMDYLIYVEAESQQEVRKWLKELNYPYSVAVDTAGLFREANNESIEGYNGYIVNKNKEILGSPLIHMRH